MRGLKVTADGLPAYVERVVRRFVADREPGERFATWAARADEEALGMSEGHSAVLHCPYCAEEDLRPHEDSHGAWLCVSCRRVFAVRLIGISPVNLSAATRFTEEPAGSAPPHGSPS